MTWLIVVLAVATVPAVYCAYDLHRLRKDAARMVADIERKDQEAESYLRAALAIHESAVKFHQDAQARWGSMLRLGRTIH